MEGQINSPGGKLSQDSVPTEISNKGRSKHCLLERPGRSASISPAVPGSLWSLSFRHIVGECHYGNINRMNRVVVTGMGAVSPVGNSLDESWAAAKAGISGIAPITRFDVSRRKWRFAGELKGFDPSNYLSRKEIIRLDPFVQYAVAAAVMAVEDAGLAVHGGSAKTQYANKGLLESAGMVIGSSRGGIYSLERSLAGGRRISAYLMPSTTISMASSYAAQKLGIRGYCLGISNACASGTSAIGEAYRLVKSGYGGPVLCGGAEAPICRTCIEGYGASGVLSARQDPSASRPFDRTRDGFVLAEGACILVLENQSDALKRGARIYGEVIGYGNTTDGFHQTAPSAEGEARAISLAMEEAGLKPEEICFISAHGTSTPLGDKTETEAIKLFFGGSARHIPVASLKSSTGHMLAASGALEAAFTLLGMNEGIIPPTINLKDRDSECDLDHVTGLRESDIKLALSQSFGFGGLNGVLIFKRI
jgi:3-oxoacyl-[acyl-carrier-protein] synthase II